MLSEQKWIPLQSGKMVSKTDIDNLVKQESKPHISSFGIHSDDYIYFLECYFSLSYDYDDLKEIQSIVSSNIK